MPQYIYIYIYIVRPVLEEIPEWVKVFIISAQRGPDLPAHLRSYATDVRSFLLRNGHQERAPAGLQVCEDVSSVLEKKPPSSSPNPEPLT